MPSQVVSQQNGSAAQMRLQHSASSQPGVPLPPSWQQSPLPGPQTGPAGAPAWKGLMFGCTGSTNEMFARFGATKVTSTVTFR